MNIYPHITVALEATLKQHELLPREEFITKWDYIESDSIYVSDFIWVETLSGTDYTFDCNRG